MSFPKTHIIPKAIGNDTPIAAPLSTLEILKNRRSGTSPNNSDPQLRIFPPLSPFMNQTSDISSVDPVDPLKSSIAENLPGQGFLDFYDESDPQLRIFPAFENYPQLTRNVLPKTAPALKQLFEQLQIDFQ